MEKLFTRKDLYRMYEQAMNTQMPGMGERQSVLKGMMQKMGAGNVMQTGRPQNVPMAGASPVRPQGNPPLR
jgi:hypothetical protein